MGTAPKRKAFNMRTSISLRFEALKKILGAKTDQEAFERIMRVADQATREGHAIFVLDENGKPISRVANL